MEGAAAAVQYVSPRVSYTVCVVWTVSVATTVFVKVVSDAFRLYPSRLTLPYLNSSKLKKYTLDGYGVEEHRLDPKTPKTNVRRGFTHKMNSMLG
jgi:hypothetical protein